MNDFKILPDTNGFSVAPAKEYWMIFNHTIEPVIPQEEVFQRNGKFYIILKQSYIGCSGPPTAEVEVYEKKDAWEALLKELKQKWLVAKDIYGIAIASARKDGVTI